MGDLILPCVQARNELLIQKAMELNVLKEVDWRMASEMEAQPCIFVFCGDLLHSLDKVSHFCATLSPKAHLIGCNGGGQALDPHCAANQGRINYAEYVLGQILDAVNIKRKHGVEVGQVYLETHYLCGAACESGMLVRHQWESNMIGKRVLKGLEDYNLKVGLLFHRYVGSCDQRRTRYYSMKEMQDFLRVFPDHELDQELLGAVP